MSARSDDDTESLATVSTNSSARPDDVFSTPDTSFSHRSGDDEDEEEQEEGCWGRQFTPRALLILFTLMNFLTYFDRGAISGSLTYINRDPNIAGGSKKTLSGVKSGFIASAFMIGYMLSSPVFACLGQWFTAKRLVLIGLLVWVVACFVTGLAVDYAMLVCFRCLVGCGEAAFAGFFVTIIDNTCPHDSRTLWIGTFYSMIPVGTALGMTVASVISEEVEVDHVAGWRIVFFAEAIVSFPIVLMTVTFPDKYNPNRVKSRHDDDDEKRGEDERTSAARAEAEDYERQMAATSPTDSAFDDDNDPDAIPTLRSEERTPLTRASGVRGIPSTEANITSNASRRARTEHAHPLVAGKEMITNINYIFVTLGYAMYTFVCGAISVFGIPMLTRGPWKMASIEAAGVIGGSVAIGGLLGSVVGGTFVDRVGGNEGDEGTLKGVIFSMVVIFVSIPLGVGSMYCYNDAGFVILFLVSVFFVFSVTAPINAATIATVPLSVRTYAMSTATFLIHALGDFPSPTVAGALSDTFDRGCSGLSSTNKNACEAHYAASKCIWVAATEDANAFCTSEFQNRNAVLIVFLFLIIALPLWTVVAVRLMIKVRRGRRSGGTDSPHRHLRFNDIREDQ